MPALLAKRAARFVREPCTPPQTVARMNADHRGDDVVVSGENRGLATSLQRLIDAARETEGSTVHREATHRLSPD